MMLDDLKDSDKITKTYVENRKEVERDRDTIRSNKVNLASKEILGHTQTGKQGFDTDEKQQWSKTTGKIAGIWLFRT